MIRSFGNQGTEDLYHGNRTKKARSILPIHLYQSAIYKLDMLDGAEQLEDLRIPPGNKLEALTGDLKGMHSIRINNQWRIIFRWTVFGVEDVEIIDYH